MINKIEFDGGSIKNKIWISLRAKSVAIRLIKL
jgi:hypothetical protein